MTTMENILASEVIPVPVNKIASRLLWKSPWWSKLQEPEQRELIQKWPESVLIDHFKPAPEGILDKIGWHFSDCIVVGFADFKESHRIRLVRNNKKPAWWVGNDWVNRPKIKNKSEREYFWWVKCGQNHIFRCGGDQINRAIRKNYADNCPECFPLRVSAKGL